MESDQTLISPTGCNLPIRELTLPKKGWECEICGFQSAFKTSLINHQAVHSDARPFECPICEYAAKRKYDLKKHIQLKHGRDESILGGSKVEYASPSQVDVVYGAVVSSSGRTNDSSLSPQHVTDHSTMSRSEVMNPVLDRTSPKITVPQYIASSDRKRQLNIKIEPQDREEEDEDAYSGGSFRESRSPAHEASVIGRETYSINAREKLTRARNTGSDSRLHSAMKAHSSHQSQLISEESRGCRQHFETDVFSLNRYPLDMTCKDSDNGTYTHRSHLTSDFQKEKSSLRYSPYSMESDIHANRHHKKWIRRFSSQTDDPSSSISTPSETPSHSEVSCSSVKTDKHCETKKTFSCPHCDILYFDHALYLMHMGLHSVDNPWKCAVCGDDFWEKYSFSSHFINLHSQVTSGE